MSPDQFLGKLKKRIIAPGYLFLGAEPYQRDRCRRTLIETILEEGERESAVTRYDLSQASLRDVLDDARSLTLFTPRRVIVGISAESVLPKQKADEETEGGDSGGGADLLGAYMQDPSPDVVLLFESSRFDFEGEEKKKLDRIRRFFSAIPEVVEMRSLTFDEACREAQAVARRTGLTMDREAIEMLVETLGAAMARIAVEIEKLAVFAGSSRPVSLEQIAALVPDARANTIFALVAALGRRDRSKALECLDTLCRDGEYLPLALTFLSTQFRTALSAKEAGLRSPQQVQSYFTKQGVAMWSSRAEQVFQTVSRFTKEQLELALKLIFQADRDFRDARPEDRVIMEQFIFRLTA